MRSPDDNDNKRLSSRLEFMLSIHYGSTSPSKTKTGHIPRAIYYTASLALLLRTPSTHSLLASTYPKRYYRDIAFGDIMYS